MIKSPAGRYPFSRFMASPSRAKRSELEHDSLASTLPGSIGAEVVVANMDGPDPDSGTCWECGSVWGASRRRLQLSPPARMAEVFVAQNPDCVQPTRPAQIRLKSGSSRPTNHS